MIVEVEMLRFGGGAIRPVEIPNRYLHAVDEEILEKVFYWGQNDFQPLQFPSVSVGDVARVNGKRYECMPIGWKLC